MGRSSSGTAEETGGGGEGPSRTAATIVLCVGVDTSTAEELDAALDGVEVVSTSAVDTAMATLESEAVGCVAGTGDLGQADGVELVETVRDQYPHLPFVLVAADGSGQVAGDVINAGVDGYVSLDEDGIDGLAARVDEAMTRRRTRTQQGRLDGIEQVVEHAADAILVTGPDGTIEYVNSTFEEVTGYDRADAVGRTPRILKSGEQCEAYYERMWETIKAGGVWEEEIVNQTKSGDRYVAHQTIAPVTDADGAVEKFVAIQRDVTEHRRFESQVAASEATLSQLYDTTFDADTPLETKLRRALEIGAEHLDHPVGYVTRIEGGTQEILAAVGSNDRIEAGATDPLERTYCRKTVDHDGPLVVGDAKADGWDGDPAFEHFGLRCYIGAEIRIDGAVYGTLCFGGEEPRDRTLLEIQQSTVKTLAKWVGYEIERHRYERTLERTNERLEKFASVISHDLRNPLHVARARLELARETGSDEHFAPIARAHDRMEAIIEDTLTLAREGELVTDVSPVSLEAIATDCWENVATGGATLAADGDVELQADPSKLRHIFENLFRNAIEHGAGEPDTVTVTVGPTADGFYVADDGPGIPPEKRERVFEQGYSDGDGTGFGLAIVETIAQAHGWSVAVTESRAGGARFEFDGDGQGPPGHPTRR
ncbi:ATP-binding protein [Haloarcula onubensis]|uniref:histidine kinase n=1 Tax=Haloarcula onubensis TaxID=2950539 RepID=A0ABU2FSP0_9EURY|nr:ATP-binding protein [Halomicroarcula sp. S3CR25-11]MDS0283267.1 PAS domain S-box protein [Halomicroarcula sp. S3CR25-11]